MSLQRSSQKYLNALPSLSCSATKKSHFHPSIDHHHPMPRTCKLYSPTLTPSFLTYHPTTSHPSSASIQTLISWTPLVSSNTYPPLMITISSNLSKSPLEIRIHNHSFSLIHHILTNSVSLEYVLYNSGVLISDISDHFPVFIELPSTCQKNKNKINLKRNFSKSNLEKFRTSLSNLDWSEGLWWSRHFIWNFLGHF